MRQTCAVESLESRVMFDAATYADRQELLANWSGSNKSALQAALNTSTVAFDTALLDYMRSRTTGFYGTDPTEVAGLISFMKTYIRPGFITPFFQSEINQINSSSDTIVNKVNGAGTSSFEKKRGEHMYELALSYRLTGLTKYRDALTTELINWARPPAGAPSTWGSDARWNTLDAGIRCNHWMWAYALALGTAGTGGLSAANNTLFLHRLMQHGQYLDAATPREPEINWLVFHGKSLMEMGVAFPEFTQGNVWKSDGQAHLARAVDAQVYADGSHAEQSPGYQGTVLNELLESYRHDQIAGLSTLWTSDRGNRLSASAESFYQMLNVNTDLSATTPAISDTYRDTSVPKLTKAGLILNTTRFPLNRVKLRDVLLNGSAKIQTTLDSLGATSFTNRGNDFAMAQGGYYVARSGNSGADRQLIFDAGPRGFTHGHFDLLNFELWGYGKALLPDPGLYLYDDSADRAWAISTAAHNTINVDGRSHGTFEGLGNGGIVVDSYTATGSYTQVTAHHHAFQHVKGRPVVGRSIWFDKDDTMVIIDWGEGAYSRTFNSTFLLPDTTPVALAGGNGYRTDNGSGDVLVQRIGSSATLATSSAFYSNDGATGLKIPATQLKFSQFGGFVVNATVIRAFNGSAPTVTATFVSAPVKGQPVQISLNRGDGSGTEIITFSPPVIERFSSTTTPKPYANDFDFDSSGTMHMAYQDSGTRTLKYITRYSDGRWSTPLVLDNVVGAGEWVSLEVDQQNNPSIAWYSGPSGDLKFSHFNGTEWETQTVESDLTVGKYCSMKFYGPYDRVFIAYYSTSKGDLKLAESNGATGNAGWKIQTLDSTGDVGKNASLAFNTNPSVLRFAIAYEDSTHGALKYAWNDRAGPWYNKTVDNSGGVGGGSINLAFSPTHLASVSYFNQVNGDLMFGVLQSGVWKKQAAAVAGSVGMFNSLVFNSAGQACIYYYNKTTDSLMRARGKFGSWSLSTVFSGGGRYAWAEVDSTKTPYVVGKKSENSRLWFGVG